MQSVLRALNRLVVDGVIETYAIGGAIGAAFYINAAQTEDVDAFMFLPSSGSGLVLLTPVYEALVSLGGVVDGEHVRFGAWPLQVLTDSNALVGEAIRQANAVDYEGIATRVFRPEHLCAVALQTGRSKDILRVVAFFEQGAVDMGELLPILKRHELAGAIKGMAAMLPARVREGL